MSKQMTKEDYNNIPVHYCKGCLFIGNTETVNVNDEEIEYCPQCGSTEFSDCHIDEWERRFEFKYKQGKFLKIKEKWKKIMERPQDLVVL